METGIDSILSTLTKMVTWLISSGAEYLAFIVESPLLLMFFVLGLIGTGLGLVSRAKHA